MAAGAGHHGKGGGGRRAVLDATAQGGGGQHVLCLMCADICGIVLKCDEGRDIGNYREKGVGRYRAFNLMYVCTYVNPCYLI